MDPIEPDGLPGKRVVLAETQPQYNDLVANVMGDGTTYTRWSLSPYERAAIMDGANIELITSTYGQPFQPVRLRVQGIEQPVISKPEDEDDGSD